VPGCVRPRWKTRQRPSPEPVPAFVVNELPGADGVYNARVYAVVDALADTMAEIDRLDLTREERIEALTSVLRVAKPASHGEQPVSRVGTGGKLWQEARQELYGQPQGRGERGRLGRGGLKG